jgi:hypothetical protein
MRYRIGSCDLLPALGIRRPSVRSNTENDRSVWCQTHYKNNITFEGQNIFYQYYQSLSFRTLCNISDNVCLDPYNCSYFIFIDDLYILHLFLHFIYKAKCCYFRYDRLSNMAARGHKSLWLAEIFNDLLLRYYMEDTLSWTFLPSMVPIHPVVLEKKFVLHISHRVAMLNYVPHWWPSWIFNR